MSLFQRLFAGFVPLAGLCLMAVGCSDRGPTTTATSTVATTTGPQTAEEKPAVKENSGEHGHKAGSHGGIIVSLGRDSFHAEAVFERGGVLRLYMLGNDESRVIDVEKQVLKAFVKVEGDADAQPFSLTAEPQEGDAADRTSQFTGTLPEGVAGRSLEVTIPNIVVSGERFRMAFKSVSEQHANADMPAKANSAEEQQLYLTPGGIYTAQDIDANGRAIAGAKYRGIVSNHSAKPEPGDRICPISMTKANPKFNWVVAGKRYAFCCPPCIDEFMRTAKTKPDEIKRPEEYVQK